MSRGNWGVIAAAVGVALVALILTALLQPEQPHLSGNTGYQEEKTGYRAGGYDCQPSVINRAGGGDRFRAAITCKEAEEQHRLQTNDLIQQRRAADAADASAVFSYQQTRIAAWGVGLGLITMAAAIAAAWYARDAASAGRLGTSYAQKSYDAFLAFEGANVVVNDTIRGSQGHGDDILWVGITMTDLGKNTAYIKKVRYGRIIGRAYEKIDLTEQIEIDSVLREKHTFSISIARSAMVVPITIAGLVEYTDAFGSQKETRFLYEMSFQIDPTNPIHGPFDWFGTNVVDQVAWA